MSGIEFIFIGNAISSPGTMGGNTKILIEFAKRWSKNGHKINIITYAGGFETCKNYGMTENPNICYYLLRWSSKLIKLGPPVFYITHTIETIKILKTLSKSSNNVVIYSSSNFPLDVIPAIIMKKFMPNCKWIATFYLFIPNPFKGYEFAYDKANTIHAPNIRVLLSYLIDKLMLPIIVKFADLIFVTNDMDKPLLESRGFDSSKIKAIYGGVSLKEINNVPSQEKKYDGCFVGRLHPQKGVTYLIEIWEYVHKQKPNAKLALIGNGSKDYENRVKKEILKRGLKDSIILFGYKDGIEKYEVLKSSKVFLHSTIYDTSGMAAAEAMACGLPVVMFDIPAMRIAYPKGVLMSPLKDCKTFAENVLKLLLDEKLYDKTREDAVEWAREWDWDKRAEEVMEAINRLLND